MANDHDQRERLFHLFHDLVGEALEQYAAGYAVDLEQRYYELADTLIADFSQQLAQAREEAERWKQARDIAFQMSIQRQNQLEAQNERLQARDAEWAESQAEAVTKYAQARALLEAFVGDEDEYEGWDEGTNEPCCCFCGGPIDKEGGPFLKKHDFSCPWLKVKQFFLAEHKEQPNG